MADFDVGGVEDQVPDGAERPRSLAFELFVKSSRQARNLRRADLLAAELLGDLFDLAGRDALHVHLAQRELAATSRPISSANSGMLRPLAAWAA